MSNFGIIDSSVIHPYKELLAYELLWAEQDSSFKKMANILTKTSRLPSDLVSEKFGLFPDKTEIINDIKKLISNKKIKFSIMLKEDPQFPDNLLDAKYPIDLIYYRGNLDITKKRLISVVGTRKISDEGIRRTIKLVSLLARHGYGIVSGLAIGTDTIALKTAIENKADVIGVIGTPIDEYYPKENHDLQEKIARDHLLISQVPFYKYSKQPFLSKKVYFVERDATMAALSEATVIVEAGDTSGTLIQARACIDQSRPLFILNSCFNNPSIKWPSKYEALGAIRVNNLEDILSILNK